MRGNVGSTATWSRLSKGILSNRRSEVPTLKDRGKDPIFKDQIPKKSQFPIPNFQRNAGCRGSDRRYRLLSLWSLVIGISLVIGTWVLGIHYWSLELGIWDLLYGQFDREPAAFAHLALHADASAVRLHDMLHNG